MRLSHFMKVLVFFTFISCIIRGGIAEVQKEWEATVNIPLSDYWEEDLVAVARTQLGYEESKTNFIRSAYGKKGYTRYGDWYGYDYMDWCVSFVSFCAHYAGIPMNLKAGNINGLINIGKKYHSYHLAKDHEPEKGDIFFRTAEDEDSIRNRELIHCGIVTDVTNTLIYTIEGNVEDRVVEKAYFRDDPVLCSYISIWDLMKADGIIILEEEKAETVNLTLFTGTGEEHGPYSEMDRTEEEYYLN